MNPLWLILIIPMSVSIGMMIQAFLRNADND